MSPIRVIFQSSPPDAADRLPEMVQFSTKGREEPGCLHMEDFRGTDDPQNLLHLELWESPRAWDFHWSTVLKGMSREGLDPVSELMGLDPAAHDGSPDTPREIGQNGIEFYDHYYFGNEGRGLQAEGALPRPLSIHWPAWSAVRIIYQSTSHPDDDIRRKSDNGVRRRALYGCTQFERFRGIEFPENSVLMETWATPAVFDDLWEMMGREVRPPMPAPLPIERRYGRPGGEWYQHCFYALVDGAWQPELPQLRSKYVIW